jgi:hypothetical protein
LSKSYQPGSQASQYEEPSTRITARPVASPAGLAVIGLFMSISKFVQRTTGKKWNAPGGKVGDLGKGWARLGVVGGELTSCPFLGLELALPGILIAHNLPFLLSKVVLEFNDSSGAV